MKHKLQFLVVAAFLLVGCKQNLVKNKIEQATGKKENIVNTVIHDKESFYHIDFSNYPDNDKTLPIGVFDSGTGGLTVLKAIVNYDENGNITHQNGSDGQLDFNKESFIYLGDQANMPYGNYSNEDKLGLLKEHIIKDAQFLMGNKYYGNTEDQTPKTDKQPVKAIVVACNTATAYGKESIEAFIKKANADIKVIGVIDAGVRGALETISKEEDAIIGVLATAGTVTSKGYHNTILKFKDQLGYSGNIEVFSQGGVGIAEAVDEISDYYDKNLNKPRDGYKGPGIQGNLKIDKTLLDVYNFKFDHGKMLCDNSNQNDCAVLQINDAENYVRYHLVSLMEKIRRSGTPNKLKSLILGCTHYPYLMKEINTVLKELYVYKGVDGSYPYKNYMTENIQLIDPAVNTAKELYQHLNEKSLFNPDGNIQDSEFYISVVNKDNQNSRTDENGNFTYDYKYGRNEGEIQQYVKVVPFSRNNISDDILTRFQEQIPFVYKLMQHFNKENHKTEKLSKKAKI
ncbi:glutamate racemase [Spongiimicrobium sp. 3-5]|uniref:glutamate racemase n=1 Tax=Spongiimicrobium sp. 3-5 TaxID=3332596 RepID=UPI0039812A44